MKEYIVSLKISFITPIGVEAKGETDALAKAKAEIKKRLNVLDDHIELEMDEDYIEEA